ncbi:MAG TPA: hypothetical protein VMW81_05985 [Nitrospinota bacterium]|nr:hypothetical protein [Nitrospinota bacterium]
MTNLKQQMYKEFAQEGINQLIEEYKRKYKPKKEDRFNYNGITYEIGPIKITDGIEFEISSKIPQEELSKKATLTTYFREVKKIISNAEKKPYSIDKENIIREISEDEKKERDYVKLRYVYLDNELYNNEEILKRSEEIIKNPQKHKIPEIYGINTLAGKLVVLSIRDAIYKKAKENMNDLISANEQVRKKFKKDGK